MLTKAQERIARARWGRIVAVAGPGSGKTRTATVRILRMLQDGIDRDEIVALTFTTRAANELRNRLVVDNRPVEIGFAGTIHAFARWILLRLGEDSGLRDGWQVWDDLDRANAIRDMVPSHRLRVRPRAIIKALRTRFAYLTEEYVEPEMRRAMDLYAAAKERANVEDFDGLIWRAHDGLLRHPLVREALIERFRHYTVDEAQDLDEAQYGLLAALRPPHRTSVATASSLLLIGDPWQGIFGFRGARPDLLERAAEAADVSETLAVNFRSRRRICGLLDQIDGRRILPHDTGFTPEGDRVDVAPFGGFQTVEFEHGGAEREFLIDSLLAHRKQHGTGWGQFAVLARTNAPLQKLSFDIEDRIPHRLVGARRLTLREEFARGVVAWLRLAMQLRDDRSCREALTLWRASESDVASLSAQAGARSLFDLMEGHGAYQHFTSLTRRLRASSDRPGDWHPVVAEFIEGCSAGYGGVPFDDLQEIVADFAHGPSARAPRTRANLIWWLLFEQGANEATPEMDVLTLSTIHQAKGLEWSRVYLMACVEGVLPAAPALHDAAAIEEERRCFYVALSRAKTDVVVSFYRNGLRGPTAPSRFLLDLQAASV